MTYQNATLLYRPFLSIWSARKKDKTESAKVNKAAGAVDGAANVHKQLLPVSKELEAVTKWAASFRQFVYDSTLPYDDSGWRIGHASGHLDFMVAVGDHMRTGQGLVEEFLAAYPSAVENARFTLNDMFSADDYPGVEEVRGKFRFSIDCSPLPTATDFRNVSGIPKEEADRLVEVAVKATEDRIQAAMAEASDRLYQVVNKMASTLAAYETKDVRKFNDTLLTNVTDLVAIMPTLNLTNDPVLAALTDEARMLTTFDLKDLRKDTNARAEAITKARHIADKMRAAASAGVTEAPAALASVTVVGEVDSAPDDEPEVKSVAAGFMDAWGDD